jgi:hypothetical protein
MAYIQGGKYVGRDNRAVGSPAGRENMTPGVAYPVPFVEANRLTTAISASISRSSDTATVTCTAHGLAVGNIARITGADQLAYNGHHRVATVTDANTYTYTVYGSPTSPATGTILSQKLLQEHIGD